MKSQRMPATPTRSRPRGQSWFRCFIIAVGVLACAALVARKLFWWFMIATATLMLAGAMVEVFCDWRQHRALSRQREEQTAKEAPAATPSTRTAQREE